MTPSFGVDENNWWKEAGSSRRTMGLISGRSRERPLYLVMIFGEIFTKALTGKTFGIYWSSKNSFKEGFLNE
jgi:hypothetical protein